MKNQNNIKVTQRGCCGPKGCHISFKMSPVEDMFIAEFSESSAERNAII